MGSNYSVVNLKREREPEERALLQPKKGTLVTLKGNFSNNREL